MALKNFAQKGYEPPSALIDRPVVTLFPALTEREPNALGSAMDYLAAMSGSSPMMGLPGLNLGQGMLGGGGGMNPLAGALPALPQGPQQAPMQAQPQQPQAQAQHPGLPPGVQPKDLLLLQ